MQFEDDYQPPNLKQHVALVTGASRGAGKGIACVLGQAGATVYVTGRSTREAGATEDLPGTIEETAEEVSRRGGKGIAVRCDHTQADQVERLFQQIASEQNHLDLLICNAWGGYEGYNPAQFTDRFWQQPIRRWETMFQAGLYTHMLAARFALPLMLQHKGGLIISTIAWLEGKYLGNLYYDVAKAAIVRFIEGLGHELREDRIAAIALAPGFMRTERVMAAHAAHPFDLSQTESPEYAGRAVAALAADVNILDKSGKTFLVGDVAREYKFTDNDGRRVPPFRIP